MSLPQHDNDKDLDRQVVRYLRDHPTFFEGHLDLLADMLLPHDRGTAVSLIERQVSVLRDQKEQHKARLQRLIKTAEQNEQLNQKIHTLVLRLMDASSLGEVLDLIPQSLKDEFNSDAVVLRLFNTDHPAIQQHPDVSDWSEPVMGAFEKVIAGRRPVCGHLKHGQLESLFNDAAEQIRSAALIPLVTDEHSKICYGLLAIGSHDPDRFRADMGTLFLTYLGQLTTRILRNYLSE